MEESIADADVGLLVISGCGTLSGCLVTLLLSGVRLITPPLGGADLRAAEGKGALALADLRDVILVRGMVGLGRDWGRSGNGSGWQVAPGVCRSDALREEKVTV